MVKMSHLAATIHQLTCSITDDLVYICCNTLSQRINTSRMLTV